MIITLLIFRRSMSWLYICSLWYRHPLQVTVLCIDSFLIQLFLNRWTVFSKTVFSIAQSTFQMYITVSDWNCLKHCIFECFLYWIVRCTETFWSPCTTFTLQTQVTTTRVYVYMTVYGHHKPPRAEWSGHLIYSYMNSVATLFRLANSYVFFTSITRNKGETFTIGNVTFFVISA